MHDPERREQAPVVGLEATARQQSEELVFGNRPGVGPEPLEDGIEERLVGVIRERRRIAGRADRLRCLRVQFVVVLAGRWRRRPQPVGREPPDRVDHLGAGPARLLVSVRELPTKNRERRHAEEARERGAAARTPDHADLLGAHGGAILHRAGARQVWRAVGGAGRWTLWPRPPATADARSCEWRLVGPPIGYLRWGVGCLRGEVFISNRLLGLTVWRLRTKKRSNRAGAAVHPGWHASCSSRRAKFGREPWPTSARQTAGRGGRVTARPPRGRARRTS